MSTRYETLVRLADRNVDRAAAAVAQASEAVAKIEADIEACESDRRLIRRPRMTSGGDDAAPRTLDVDRLLGEGRYEMQLEAKLRELRAILRDLRQEQQRRLAAWTEARAEGKRYEHLRTKDAERQRLKRDLAEQRESDDRTAARFRDPTANATFDRQS